MSITKKIMVALAAASVFILSSCTTSEDGLLDLQVSRVNATIGGASFSQLAAAKVSDDSTAGQDSLVSGIFSTDGTMIVAADLKTGEKLFITYRGKTAGTYKTGLAATDTVVTNLLDYLVSGNGGNLSPSNFASANANVTYVDANGEYWFSTLCTINITGQSNGITLSLISGSFECDVYKKGGNSSTKKHVTGTIHNVVGIQ